MDPASLCCTAGLRRGTQLGTCKILAKSAESQRGIQRVLGEGSIYLQSVRGAPENLHLKKPNRAGKDKRSWHRGQRVGWGSPEHQSEVLTPEENLGKLSAGGLNSSQAAVLISGKNFSIKRNLIRTAPGVKISDIRVSDADQWGVQEETDSARTTATLTCVHNDPGAEDRMSSVYVEVLLFHLNDQRPELASVKAKNNETVSISCREPNILEAT
ncbi:hypothetical protein DUI87_17263 [Hirundo rustica rustica]|uniref:Transmembrane protein TMEM132 cohesin-like domain-containing protein n=1 Tax=Hirundo rustica rustica TaxID=333673 RepID=A0A3M0K3A3_HIRRU|nr:hypothetical protein DUI87_17263 [Hirundo rustica rustica]